MECFNEESARPGGLFHLSEDMLQVSRRGWERERARVRGSDGERKGGRRRREKIHVL